MSVSHFLWILSHVIASFNVNWTFSQVAFFTSHVEFPLVPQIKCVKTHTVASQPFITALISEWSPSFILRVGGELPTCRNKQTAPCRCLVPADCWRSWSMDGFGSSWGNQKQKEIITQFISLSVSQVSFKSLFGVLQHQQWGLVTTEQFLLFTFSKQARYFSLKVSRRYPSGFQRKGQREKKKKKTLFP